VRLLYFAALRERLGKAEDSLIPPPTLRTLHDLALWLVQQDEQYACLLEASTCMAVNHQQADWDTLLEGAEDIAFFPPMTGG
jgi:sulfur-carrier protein